MNPRKKLELSRETLRDLTSDLPSEQLVGVRGGENASVNTCLDCVTTIIAATYIDTDCWVTHTR